MTHRHTRVFLLLILAGLCSWVVDGRVLGATSKSGLQTQQKNPVDIGEKDPDGDKRYATVLRLCGGSTSGDGLAAVDWRFFVAGGLCASISHGWTTPLDVIKTKMQQKPEKFKSGMLAAARSIVAEEGAGVLLAGLAPTVVGYGIEGAAKFGLYEAFKTLLAQVDCLNKFTSKLLASVIAGAFAAMLLCPMEEARIKMVGDPTWAKENLVSGMTRLLLEGGLLSTFVGLPAMLLKQIPYTMGKQVSFDIIAEFFYALAGRQSRWTVDELRWTISIMSAFCASIVACLASQPGDVLLTETYGGHGHGPAPAKGATSTAKQTAPRSVVDIARDIRAKHGLAGFYLGLQARLSHVASIITSQLVINDLIKTALGLPATGSH
jgi:solute carrier family 25 phosphate transporter 3